MPPTSTPYIRSFAWLLAGLVALGPLAIDAYLPAMPIMATDLATSLHNIEITLSVFLIGFAAGQLIGGPISDHFGRVLQAFGGGMGVVNTMAVVRDRAVDSFAVNVIALSICNQINIRVLQHFEPAQVLRMGQLLQFIIGTIMVASVWLFELPIYLLVPQIMLFVGMQGFVVANGMSTVTDFFPTNSATASALVSSSGFTLGAIVGGAGAIFSDGSPLTMVTVMALCPLTGMLTSRLLHRSN